MSPIANRFHAISGESRRSTLLMLATLAIAIMDCAHSLPSRGAMSSIRSSNSRSAVYFDREESPDEMHAGFSDRGSSMEMQESTKNQQRSHHDSRDAVHYPGNVHHGAPRFNFVPELDPSCAGKTFCEEVVSYPTEFVDDIVAKMEELQQYNKVDSIELANRNDPADDSMPLCQSTSGLVYPKVAESKDNGPLFIVNSPKFQQGVRVETCEGGSGGSDLQCSHIGEFAEGYKTTCKQKYIYRELAGLSMNGTVVADMFRMPASCCCHLKFEPGTSARFGGVGSKNQTKTTKSKD